jgi:F-type H+-transporting ATPase subunit gamma
MATKRKLERSIASTQDMSSIVSTMKALAAVNVRVFGQARDAIENYMDTVERGLQVVLAGDGESFSPVQRSGTSGLGLFVFGAVQGMCGQFNDHIAARAPGFARRIEDDAAVVAVDQLRQRGIGRVVVFYNTDSGRSSYEPHHELVLPISGAWLGRIARRSWPSRTLPAVVTSRADLLAALTRQYLFASFYRAAAQSLSSENAARLASMHSAESNIDDRLDELESAYNQQRQQEITSELLDIVGGYTALRESE